MDALDGIEKVFLFDGYQEFFRGLVPNDEHFPYVMAHNDSQENNVLVKHSPTLELVLIDVEYAGWNPMAFDLGNYFAETMFENASKATETGTDYFLENMMTRDEIQDMAGVYLITYFTNYMTGDKKQAYADVEDFLAQKLPIFVD